MAWAAKTRASRGAVPARSRGVRFAATTDQLGDPLTQSIAVFGVVLATRLANPPRRFVRRLVDIEPLLDHPRPAGIGLDPRDVPRLVLHRREERRVEAIDVDLVALVRPGTDLLELDLGLGEPRAQVGHDVADRPVRIPVVAGLEALLGGQRPDELGELVPASSFGLDLGAVRVLGADVCRARHERAIANSPSSGSPASSQSSRPPE